MSYPATDHFLDHLPPRPPRAEPQGMRLLIAVLVVNLAALAALVFVLALCFLWWLFWSGPDWKPTVYVDREQGVVCTERSDQTDSWRCAEMGGRP